MADMTAVDPSLLYIMLKGEPGTRKSTAALSFAELGDMFWFSFDRKMSGLLVPMRKWGIDPKKIQFEDYSDWDKPRQQLEKFIFGCPYKTLVIDSLTSMADMTLHQTLTAKAGLLRKGGKTAGKMVAGIAVNEIEDYNAESAALQELIALTKEIHITYKVNIILIAHVVQAEYRNTLTNETHVSRTIITAGKKVAPKIPAYCGEVYHFDIKKGPVIGEGGQYKLLTENTGDDFARTALDLPREIIFNDKPLYSGWIKPAIDKMKSEGNTIVNPIK